MLLLFKCYCYLTSANLTTFVECQLGQNCERRVSWAVALWKDRLALVLCLGLAYACLVEACLHAGLCNAIHGIYCAALPGTRYRYQYLGLLHVIT